MSHMSNPLARSSQLYARRSVAGPSSGGGRVGAPLATDLQDAVFVAGQALTQAAGKLLRLPQSATAQACVLLARFWLVERVMSCEFSVSSVSFEREGDGGRKGRDKAAAAKGHCCVCLCRQKAMPRP